MDQARGPLTMPTDLSAFDTLLHRGESNPRTRSGLMSVEILESAPDWARFRRTFENASRRVPRMRQKVVVPTLPVTSPRWVCDPDFSLDYHVRRVRVAAPGTLRQVMDLAEVMVQAPMDVARPLWTATLVEGLVDNRAAALLHMSHAVTDGVGGAEMFLQVYDFEPEPAPRSTPPLPVPADLSANDLLLEGIRRLPGRLAHGVQRSLADGIRTLARVAAQPGSSVTGTVDYARSAARMMTQAAEPSPLLRRRTLSSRSVAIDVAFTDLYRAAKAAGGTLNDAYLAGLCGAMRRYHHALGTPIAELPMAVPVSLRNGSHPAGGNHFTGVNLAAPIDEPDPANRIKHISGQMAARRTEPALDIASAVAPIVSRIPTQVLEGVGNFYQPADIQASNVPVFAEDSYLAGTKVLRQYGIGPLPGVAMMVVMVSRSGTCTVTVRYDRGSVTDERLLEQSLLEGFDEVLELAGGAAPAVLATSDPQDSP